MSDKVKVTLEEKNVLDKYLSCNERFEEKVKYYVNYSFSFENDYLPLKKMGLEKFVKCLIQGYELSYPKTPELKTEKINISFNYSPDSLSKDKEIFIGLRSSNGGYARCDSFSIGEAMDIRNTLNKLFDYYETYCSQND